MGKRFGVIDAIRTCSRDNWGSTGTWFAYTVGYGFVPLYVGMLAVRVFSEQPIDFSNFVVHGEFAIYSATLVAASTRLISKDSDIAPFVRRQLFILIAGLSMIIAVALYAMIKAAAFLNVRFLNTHFVLLSSAVVLGVSLLFSFLVFLLDHQRFHPNVAEITAVQRQRLGEDFDSLRGE